VRRAYGTRLRYGRPMHVLALWAVLLLWPRSVRAAEPEPLTVTRTLRDAPLGPSMAVLRDNGGMLGIDDVSGGPAAAAFRRVDKPIPSLGFSSAAIWVRFQVQNPSADPCPWLLALGAPMLDDVKLFIPRAGGTYALRHTGDFLPFSTRDLSHRSFVFNLEEPASSSRTYYLRVASSSPLRIPLSAWSTQRFIEYQHEDWTALCMFYGIILVMVLYSVSLCAFGKQWEYLPYAGYTAALGLFQFTNAGHTAQFLLQDQCMLVHRIQPLSVVAALVLASYVLELCFPSTANLRAPAQHFRRFLAAFAVFCLLAPIHWVTRGVTVTVLLVLCGVSAMAFQLWARNRRDARLFLLGWGATIVGGSVTALHNLGLLPVHLLTTWSMQIGISLQLVLLSSALADKLNVASAALSVANAGLSQKCEDLCLALERAEAATHAAEHALKRKGEFVATMSHEFRTPLNPIINIPEGLRSEFQTRSHAMCGACACVFALESGEIISHETPCPECGATDRFTERRSLVFTGDPQRARRMLATVESSGKDLLTVVNAVLDFSKLQAGHLRLHATDVNLAGTLAALRAEFGPVADSRKIRVDWPEGIDTMVLHVDAARLRQMLHILLHNALKFSEPGTCIEVRAVQDQLATHVSIKDQGIGIAPAHRITIFDGFEQVHTGNTRRFGGVGLGLAIARGLARKHGGDVSLRSALGIGSVFTLSLPTRGASGGTT
jgi:signal transduction histidine kinase